MLNDPVILSHSRSTQFSLETYPFIQSRRGRPYEAERVELLLLLDHTALLNRPIPVIIMVTKLFLYSKKKKSLRADDQIGK